MFSASLSPSGRTGTTVTRLVLLLTHSLPPPPPSFPSPPLHPQALQVPPSPSSCYYPPTPVPLSPPPLSPSGPADATFCSPPPLLPRSQALQVPSSPSRTIIHPPLFPPPTLAPRRHCLAVQQRGQRPSERQRAAPRLPSPPLHPQAAQAPPSLLFINLLLPSSLTPPPHQQASQAPPSLPSCCHLPTQLSAPPLPPFTLRPRRCHSPAVRQRGQHPGGRQRAAPRLPGARRQRRLEGANHQRAPLRNHSHNHGISLRPPWLLHAQPALPCGRGLRVWGRVRGRGGGRGWLGSSRRGGRGEGRVGVIRWEAKSADVSEGQRRAAADAAAVGVIRRHAWGRGAGGAAGRRGRRRGRGAALAAHAQPVHAAHGSAPVAARHGMCLCWPWLASCCCLGAICRFMP